jgi:RNA polymerase sigma-70 factor (ECF subfamily)
MPTEAIALERWLSALVTGPGLAASRPVEPDDQQLIAAVRRGETEAFEPLVQKYQPRIFATARRYARRESEVEDIVQEVFLKAFQKLDGFRGDAPFEHWLMRLAVRTCYDFLRQHQRNRETAMADITDEEEGWMERFAAEPESTDTDSDAARALVQRLMERLSPASRLVITLLEIEEKSVKEIAAVTGWSVTAVKVRAFRARAEMRKYLRQLTPEKYL